jgi:outer membrane receptor protein involved in Fe transport
MRNERTRSLLIRSAIRSALAAPLVLPSALLHAQDADVAASASTTASAAMTIAEAETKGSALEEVVVLGTRRTDRSVTDSASPVDIVGAAELKTQPAADMLEVLKNVVPSFNVQQNQISDASTFVRAPSLRGLAGDMTLVMINGKRLNRAALVQVAASDPTNALSQGADLSVLPSIAFGGLQILREGASILTMAATATPNRLRAILASHWARAASSRWQPNTTMTAAPSATRRVLLPFCSQTRIRTWLTSCLTIRTRSSSLATRPPKAGSP